MTCSSTKTECSCSKVKWSCRLGWHKWYYGEFIKPVYGRYERHCLDCPKRQFAKYISKKRHWVDFIDEDYEPQKTL